MNVSQLNTIMPTSILLAVAIIWLVNLMSAHAFQSHPQTQGPHAANTVGKTPTVKIMHENQPWHPQSRKFLTLPLLPKSDDAIQAVRYNYDSLAVLQSLAQDVGDQVQSHLAMSESMKDIFPREVTESLAEKTEELSKISADLFSSNPKKDLRCHKSTAYALAQAGLVGTMTGSAVVLFKLSIDAVRSLCYEQDFLVNHHGLLPLIPALGGAVVGLLQMSGSFSPGMKGTIEEVDEASNPVATPTLTDHNKGNPIVNHVRVQTKAIRKTMAAVATLGTGCSLGPEGPCVEIGLNVARACTQLNAPSPESNNGNVTTTFMAFKPGEKPHELLERGWNRILLSCGAAAGVAAGFNAPLAGVFFALEIMQKTFASIDKADGKTHKSDSFPCVSTLLSTTSTATITPILLASVLSALISQSFLGDHLVLTLTHFNVKTPLVELPLYLLLGGLSGVVAFAFNQSSRVSQQLFSGKFGHSQVQKLMSFIPDAAKPMIGGLLCGLVGLLFPQVLFFGYETLNSLLKDSAMPMDMALTLLVTKAAMTAISAGTGLVGGTFALALFLGGMLGSAFQNGMIHSMDAIMNWVPADHVALDASTLGLASQLANQVQLHAIPFDLQIADVPAYAMVGAASVLAASFHAPLTASLLLFEVTRSYDAILPLMGAAAVATIVADMLQDRFKTTEHVKNEKTDDDSVLPLLYQMEDTADSVIDLGAQSALAPVLVSVTSGNTPSNV